MARPPCIEDKALPCQHTRHLNHACPTWQRNKVLISTGHLLYAWCSVSSFCFLNQLYQGERDSERLGDVPEIAQLLRGRGQVRLGSVTQKPALFPPHPQPAGPQRSPSACWLAGYSGCSGLMVYISSHWADKLRANCCVLPAHFTGVRARVTEGQIQVSKPQS